MPDVGALDQDTLREALRLLGSADPPSHRAAAARELRAHFTAPGAVRSLLDGAAPEGREAFTRLCHEGAASVERLLGRGWWGRGALPPPLDWLQRRALVQVGEDGLVYPTDEARAGFTALVLDLHEAPREASTRVDPAATVVVSDDPHALDRAVAVDAAALRAVAPTVAVSQRSPEAVSAALRAAGVALDADAAIVAEPRHPALPGTPEDAVGPRAIRLLLHRAVDERRQLRLQYFASSRGGAATERVVDPWRFADDLLVGYCHLRAGERTFAVDRIGQARLLPSPVAHAAPTG